MTSPIEPSLSAVLDRKMALRGNTVYEPTPIETVSKQLDGFLADQLDGAFAVRGLSKLTGGASMEQYAFSLERPDTGEPTTRMILRMSPLCSVIETSRLREAQIIAAVHGTVPAPRVFFVAPQSDAFGKPALISSFDEGVTAPTGGGGNASGLGTAYGSSRAALAPQFVRHLAALHTMDWSDKDLSALEGTGEMTAILDWEAGHLGDRHMDLAYAMLPGYGTLGEDGTYYCAGLVERREFIREYERHSGLSVDSERLTYYTVLNMYWAVIACCGTGPRLAAEHMTHLDTMMNLVPGLGMFFIRELNAILREDS